MNDLTAELAATLARVRKQRADLAALEAALVTLLDAGPNPAVADVAPAAEPDAPTDDARTPAPARAKPGETAARIVAALEAAGGPLTSHALLKRLGESGYHVAYGTLYWALTHDPRFARGPGATWDLAKRHALSPAVQRRLDKQERQHRAQNGRSDRV
jgi:hypothetical protein